MRFILSIWFILFTSIGYSQTKDTVLYNQFRDYVEWSKQRHKQIMDEQNDEKYQMVYVDKYLIDRKRHKIYVFSSYDLYWGDWSGIGWEFVFPHKKRKPSYSQLKPKPLYW